MLEFKNPEREYLASETCVYSCQYHIIFATKYRRKYLVDGIDERLKELILQQQDEYGYTVIEQEIMPDHVHLLLAIPPDVTPNTIIRKIKGYTSTTLRREYPSLTTKTASLWTRSKFISTCGSVSLNVVKNYIENQKKANSQRKTASNTQ